MNRSHSALLAALLIVAGCTGRDEASPATTSETTNGSETNAQPAEVDAADERDADSTETRPTAPGDQAATTTTTTLVVDPLSGGVSASTVPGSTASGDEPTGRAEPGGESLGPLGSSELELDTGDGQVQIGTGSVPPIAADFPAPEDLDIELSSTTGDSAGYSGRTAASVIEMTEFYRDEMPIAGYTIDSEESAGSIVLIAFSSASGASGELVISTAPGGGTSVIVTIADSTS